MLELISLFKLDKEELGNLKDRPWSCSRIPGPLYCAQGCKFHLLWGLSSNLSVDVIEKIYGGHIWLLQYKQSQDTTQNSFKTLSIHGLLDVKLKRIFLRTVPFVTVFALYLWLSEMEGKTLLGHQSLSAVGLDRSEKSPRREFRKCFHYSFTRFGNAAYNDSAPKAAVCSSW